jgi:transposase
MRPKYSFPAEVVEVIARERYHHPHPRVQERMEILWLKSQGEPNDRIAPLANVSRSTVQRTLRIYVAEGLEGVRGFDWKGQPSALTPHHATIEAEFRQRPPRSAQEAALRIEALTGVKRKVTQVRKFLKETLGMKCLKVAAVPVPPKLTVDEHAQVQAAFLKSAPRTAFGGDATRRT